MGLFYREKAADPCPQCGAKNKRHIRSRLLINGSYEVDLHFCEECCPEVVSFPIVEPRVDEHGNVFTRRTINCIYPMKADRFVLREAEESDSDVTPPPGFFTKFWYSLLAWYHSA